MGLGATAHAANMLNGLDRHGEILCQRVNNRMLHGCCHHGMFREFSSNAGAKAEGDDFLEILETAASVKLPVSVLLRMAAPGSFDYAPFSFARRAVSRRSAQDDKYPGHLEDRSYRY
jgi:hypothetical protein